MLYDVFISHASEDKDTFVRPLADALRKENIEVWYDEFSLQLGDRIRQSIDKGLQQSRFGVIVLSPAFFSKHWPQYELDGLVESEMNGSHKVILPIWHEIGKQEIFRFSPSLANRHAVSSTQGLDCVVKKILQVVKPQGSPLIIARDLLLKRGITPPVVTDQYWLEIVEASNRVPASGAEIPTEAHWGRWSFPLPQKNNVGSWGERLALTVMQLNWSNVAESEQISLLTPPEKVLSFVRGQPGLHETCEMFPELFIQYAPQLAIPGMGGDFESMFETLYQQSIKEYNKHRKEESKFGTGLTIDQTVPICDEVWSLRSPVFGNYKPEYVVEEYFSGGMFGPPVSPYEHIEHLVWLLSDACNWLPANIREYFIDGMARWGAWLWTPCYAVDRQWEFKGELRNAILYERSKNKDFKWSNKTQNDAINAFENSIDILGLPETPETIFDRFIECDIINRLFDSLNEKQI